MHGRNATKGNEEAGLGGSHEAQRLYEKQLIYRVYWYPWYHYIVQFSQVTHLELSNHR
jgi:hypothetical protein